MKIKDKKYGYFSLLLGVLLLLGSCKTSRKLSKTRSTKKQTALAQQLANSSVFQGSFTGFMLYDPQTKEVLEELQADKYFTPASNAKILTLYTALNILGDSIPALRYVVRGDSLIFWGTGDPSLLHPALPQNDKVLQFLGSRKENLFFCSQNFQEPNLGAGWAWDDFPYAFSAEKSPLPVHANYVSFSYQAGQRRFAVDPPYFKYYLQPNPQIPPQKIKRKLHQNIFEFNKTSFKKTTRSAKVPFLYSHELLVELLGSLVGKRIALYPHASMPPASAKVLYSVSSHSLYQEMMRESDNLIAEQLLLLCGNALNDTLNLKKVIRQAKQSFLKDCPDQPNWRDGSGLSRYNLVTPRTLVHVLDQLYQEVPEAKLFDIFPAGGVSGTLKNWYPGEKPYVYAKTGTLSNNHCLSGYLIADSGKRLIFSFMHNNYVIGSRAYKLEMQKVLEKIKTKY